MEGMKKVSTFAERLNTVITETGRRPADLSREANLSRTTVSRYLRGTAFPAYRTLCRLAKLLNVSEHWLNGFDVPPTRPLDESDDNPMFLTEDGQKTLALIGEILLDPALLRMVDQYLKLPKADKPLAQSFMDALCLKNGKTP